MRDGREGGAVLPQSPEAMGTWPLAASGEGSAASSAAGRHALRVPVRMRACRCS